MLLIRLFHPDRVAGASDADLAYSSRLNAAYHVLRDPEERARYDQGLPSAFGRRSRQDPRVFFKPALSVVDVKESGRSHRRWTALPARRLWIALATTGLLGATYLVLRPPSEPALRLAGHEVVSTSAPLPRYLATGDESGHEAAAPRAGDDAAAAPADDPGPAAMSKPSSSERTGKDLDTSVAAGERARQTVPSVAAITAVPDLRDRFPRPKPWEPPPPVTPPPRISPKPDRVGADIAAPSRERRASELAKLPTLPRPALPPPRPTARVEDRPAPSNISMAPPVPAPPAKRPAQPPKVTPPPRATPPAKTAQPVKPKPPAKAAPRAPAVEPVEIGSRLVSRLESAYGRGNADAVAALFTKSARTSDGSGQRRIRGQYAKLFRENSAQRLVITNVRWRSDRDARIRGSGRFSASTRNKSTNDWRRSDGRIQFELVPAGGDYRISSMLYQLD